MLQNLKRYSLQLVLELVWQPLTLYHYGAFDPLIGNIRLLAEEVQLLRGPNEAVRETDQKGKC